MRNLSQLNFISSIINTVKPPLSQAKNLHIELKTSPTIKKPTQLSGFFKVLKLSSFLYLRFYSLESKAS